MAAVETGVLAETVEVETVMEVVETVMEAVETAMEAMETAAAARVGAGWSMGLPRRS